MSDTINQAIVGKITPKKRKAPLTDPADSTDFKEPRLSDVAMDSLDTLQRGRLKSAYEWGNLEDAIYDGKKENGNISDTESIDNEMSMSKLSSSSIDMMTEVLAAADKFDKEIKDIDLNEVINVVTTSELATAKTEAANMNENNGVPKRDIKHEAFVINWEPESKPILAKALPNEYTSNIHDTKKFIEIESRNGFHTEKQTNGTTHSPEPVEEDNLHKVETITISPAAQFQYKSSEFTDADAHMNETAALEKNDSDQVKIINYGSNMPDDVKVSRYPFGSLERPKSEVLKKLIAEQISAEEHHKIPNGISSTKIVPDPDTVSIETANTYSTSGPISLTLGGHIESDLTESSQISPVFSSDGQGVNSISISSTESSIRPESRKDQLPSMLAPESVVTITTDGSQPSSIIMIDDEKLNFALQTLKDEPAPKVSNIPQPSPPRAAKDEVFIIESLSSKKVQESQIPRINGDLSPPPKSFVTEIRLQNSRKDHKINMDDVDETIDTNTQELTSTVGKLTNATSPTPIVHHTEKSVIVEEEYIPRNTEIKFTTSTYESPQRPFEKRHSHIDQIRSNFERNYNSEIPVPVRKSAPAATSPTSNVRTSPSKIPVFHSQKSSDNLLKNGNGNVNRVSVTVTSIKNSSRNPSGK